MVEHEEGREVAKSGRADGAANPGTHALGLLAGEEDLADGARNGHVCGFEMVSVQVVVALPRSVPAEGGGEVVGVVNVGIQGGGDRPRGLYDERLFVKDGYDG